MKTFNEYFRASQDATPDIPIELVREIELARAEAAAAPLTESRATNVEPAMNDPRYVIYKDRSENFVCEVQVEGASSEGMEVKLMLESSDINLFFVGSVDSHGKCVIPLRKLPMLREGLEGNLKMEVIADDMRFIPWESPFVVKASKKVSVIVESQVASPRGPSVTIRR